LTKENKYSYSYSYPQTHEFFSVRGAGPQQLIALTDEEYFLRQGGRNVGGQEVWAEPECPALAPALVSPGQEDEALLRGALVSRYEEFLVRTIGRIFTTPSKAVVWVRIQHYRSMQVFNDPKLMTFSN
jgi:hypothetical protein